MDLASGCCAAYYSTSLLVLILIYGKRIKKFFTSKKRFYMRWFYNYRSRSKGYRLVPNHEI